MKTWLQMFSAILAAGLCLLIAFGMWHAQQQRNSERYALKTASLTTSIRLVSELEYAREAAARAYNGLPNNLIFEDACEKLITIADRSESVAKTYLEGGDRLRIDAELERARKFLASHVTTPGK